MLASCSSPKSTATMNCRFLLLALVTAAPVLYGQRIVTVETATELVTPASFDSGPNDDLAVLDRASGVLRIGMWNGTTLTWTDTSAGVEGVDYLGVGYLELAPATRVMSVAVGKALAPSLDVYTPATSQRFSLSGLGVLPSTCVVMPLGGTALDDLLVGSSGVYGTNTGLAGLLNNGAFTVPTLADRKVAGQLTLGSRVSQGAAFISDGTALEIWVSQGFPNMKRRARLAGLAIGTRYAAGHFDVASPDSFVLWVPGSTSFQHASILADGITFTVPENRSAGLPLGSLQVITSNSAQDWLLAISQDGATAQLFNFTPGSAPELRQSFSAPTGTSFSAATAQGSGHIILLNGSGGRTTGWQRATFNGTSHTLSANTTLPDLKPSHFSPTIFLFTAEPWVDPSASLRSTRDIGDWTTSIAAGTASALTDLGIPNGLGSLANISVSAIGGFFPLPNQVAPAISLASLGSSGSTVEPTPVFTPPPGVYSATFDPGNQNSFLALPISLTTTLPAGIRWRLNGGVWQNYSADRPPALTGEATLEAYVVKANGEPLGPITRGSYRFGPTPVLETAAFVDANGNGLSDSWEKMHGISDPAGDPDNDGYTNLQEFTANTDPRDPLSVPSGDNLLPFGNAEGLGGGDGSVVVPIPGWTVSGNLTVTKWGTDGFPGAASPGPLDRGANFFSGGSSGVLNTATTVVNLSDTPARIDSGRVSVTLSGWLGGYSSQADSTTLTATFLDSAGGRLNSFQIGPVTPQDRDNTTSLLNRSASRVVPASARRAEVVLEMRTDGQCCFNDGYADSLSFVLRDNQRPIANTGPSLTQSVSGGEIIAIDGSASFDPESAPLTYAWSQLAGPRVTLTGGATAKPSFPAPAVTELTIFSFQLIVNDGVQGSVPTTTQVTLSPPAPIADTIFDNIQGTDSGSNYADSTLRQACRVCLETQAYTLDSVALLLSSRQIAINPIVQLKIYSSDPLTGKPSIDAGLVMTLSGETNPIVFKAIRGSTERLVTWTPATPFVLAANRCYWAVLIVESGEVLLASSSSKPSGAAGTFGSTDSRDAGATWGTLDLESNRKMLIHGFASGEPEGLGVTGFNPMTQELQLGFPTEPGHTYVLETLQELTAGSWGEVPGTTQVGDGTRRQVAIRLNVNQPHRFYRVRRSP